MSDDLPPLDGQLASLFDAERTRAEPAADAAKARVFSRIEGSLAAGTSTLALAKLGPLLASLVVGGAIGAGVTSYVQKPQVVYIDRSSAPATTSPPVVVAPTSNASVVPPQPSAPSAPPSAPPVARVEDTLARERALLDGARTSLVHGDASAALAAADRHAHDFPRGQMAEEREALAIQALAKLGRAGEATDRAADFRSRYPNSVLGPAVDSVTVPPTQSKQ